LISQSQRVAESAPPLFRGQDRKGAPVAKRRDNVLIVHWHDLGRYLDTYGHAAKTTRTRISPTPVHDLSQVWPGVGQIACRIP